MSKRRWLVLIVVPLITLSGCASVIDYLQRPPDRERAAADMVFGGELFAYEILHGTPHVVFQRPSGGKLVIDHLRQDWISIEFPPTPAWQLTGNFSGTWMTSDPASVAVSQCTGGRCQGDTELYGQINAPEIVAMDVRYENEWHRYPVGAPGYVVKLKGYHGVPDETRWLDADGDVVWSGGP